jgi:hypothetical protein
MTDYRAEACEHCGSLNRHHAPHCPRRVYVRRRPRYTGRPCPECVALLDAVTGASPGCPQHRATSARAREQRPERGEAERRIDQLRASGVPLPRAVDLRQP